jgi:HEAT repeat protein
MTTLWLFLALVAAERPELVAGRLEVLGAVSNLSSAVERIAGTAWAGYSVPMVAGSHHFCGGGEVVRLDSGGDFDTRSEPGGSRSLFVLYRVENGRAVEIRLLSAGCRIDAGAHPLYWWEPVAPGESLRHLRALALPATNEGLAEDAVHAAAMHADSEADDLLEEISRDATSREARERAIFWLGAVRGDEGFRRLAARFGSERDSKLREEIVFAIHLSKAEGAIPKLVSIARKDGDADVRERALFWLAQRAGDVAARAIANAVKDDPDLEVKKKAVFALSQLPSDEGVPLLMEVAETHPNPEVRKQAFFWLGQTDDPRALDLFERVLLRK